MKKKLQLDVVRNLRDEVEDQITNLYKFIQNSNEDNVDLEPTMQKLEKLEEQFLVLKEVIQDANRNKHSDTKKTNNYYVYLLSNLNKRAANLREISISNNDNAYLTSEDISEELAELRKEIGNIKSRLTTFNRDTIVKVDIDETLNLNALKLLEE